LGTLPKGFEALKTGSLVRIEEDEGAEYFRDAAYASAVADVASSTIASSIINRAVVGERDTRCGSALRDSGDIKGDRGRGCEGGEVSKGCRIKGLGLLLREGDSDLRVVAGRNRGVVVGAVVGMLGGE
jgi:hypothetical protein